MPLGPRPQTGHGAEDATDLLEDGILIAELSFGVSPDICVQPLCGNCIGVRGIVTKNLPPFGLASGSLDLAVSLHFDVRGEVVA